jgi:predicted RNase H-like HicB family nuclease
MTITLECVQETTGRWFAEVPQIPGVQAYGTTRDAAAEEALAMVYRLLDDARRLGVPRADTADVFGRESERRPGSAGFESALS